MFAEVSDGLLYYSLLLNEIESSEEFVPMNSFSVYLESLNILIGDVQQMISDDYEETLKMNICPPICVH